MERNSLQVEDLSFAYDRGKSVLEDVSFSVRGREFVSIVGMSGCGKSTLLKLIAGILSPDSGQIRFDGRLRMVFQEDRLFPWASVITNVALGGGRNDGEIRARALQLLSEFGIECKASELPARLSGGQRQRAALCRAFIGTPELILLDEPFSSLDFENRRRAQFELLDLIERTDVSTIFVTHDIEEAILLSDRVLLLKEGVLQPAFEVPFGRPRDEALKFDSRFVKLRRDIFKEITGDFSRI